ncbi:hypothetical protein ESZ50_00510 [Weissella muntiaci]|uniref:Uncharacterized protein n=2 Tax=Weissella muntiaci TaxID=2508881 RepID=A0A6C2CC06_9LACO|nr:hypothetical protein ESZ50_00510 [Weissella muntiaci]
MNNSIKKLSESRNWKMTKLLLGSFIKSWLISIGSIATILLFGAIRMAPKMDSKINSQALQMKNLPGNFYQTFSMGFFWMILSMTIFIMAVSLLFRYGDSRNTAKAKGRV